MNFSETELAGAFVIDLEQVRDERGFFARAWCAREFEAAGLTTVHAQTNLSYNALAGTLRGLHYQVAPHQEAKLVRCIRGSIFDVIVDLRSDSDTCRQWTGVELTAGNRRMLYVPAGFAHAFQTLEDDTEVLYQVNEFYTPGAERGLRFDDPAIGIRWPREVSMISDKDAGWPALPAA
ncbi:MAG: dTDP-4-dehydrorhamnose 3,5-epimerase [Pseudomonadales bacterium]